MKYKFVLITFALWQSMILAYSLFLDRVQLLPFLGWSYELDALFGLVLAACVFLGRTESFRKGVQGILVLYLVLAGVVGLVLSVARGLEGNHEGFGVIYLQFSWWSLLFVGLLPLLWAAAISGSYHADYRHEQRKAGSTGRNAGPSNSPG